MNVQTVCLVKIAYINIRRYHSTTKRPLNIYKSDGKKTGKNLKKTVFYFSPFSC